jgi:hypothetical protein
MASAVAFFVTTPYSIIDFYIFLNGIMFDALHYASGHEGMETSSIKWYLSYLIHTENIILPLAGLRLLFSIIHPSRKKILLCGFPITYFLFISCFSMRNPQTLLPAVPFLFVLASSFIQQMWAGADINNELVRKLLRATIICVTVVSLILPTIQTVTKTKALAITDSRETARIWIENNLEHGSKIALEAYCPYVEKKHFIIHGTNKINEKPPAWYIANKFDYLVFSSRMYNRFYNHPDLYQLQINRYNLFFSTFDLVKIFSDGGFEVKIYRVPYTD